MRIQCWPVKFVLLLSDKPHLVNQTIVQAKSDYEVLIKLKAKTHRSDFEDSVLASQVCALAQ